MKWVVVAALVALVAMALLWRELGTSGSAPSAPSGAPTAARDDGSPRSRPRRDHREYQQRTPQIDRDDPNRPQITEAPEGPITKFSDEFWERVDEVYSRRLLGFAADCDHGDKRKKQKLKVSYHLDITEGRVVVRDVQIVESTLGDPALERCMVKAVQAAHFADPRMPDWSSEDADPQMLLIRIDTLKRFGPATD